ncbi:MAG TPA: DUF1254 domain-containing protein [Ktedonobacterales bacterium]|nr:DUF1254 domain-containing protein [Ktedonobacterales bacterium]
MANRDNTEPTSQKRPTASDSASSPAPRARARIRWKAHLLTFAVTMLVVWGVGTAAYIYFSPRLAYNRVENAIVSGHGSGVPPIPINTLYTQPTLASPSQSNSLESTENRDTLYTVGWLDLSTGPQVLHVPDMAGRYYAVQLTDPWGTVFAYVGRRTTGTQAGDYLISGPGWKGAVPAGVTQQIVSPNNTVLVIGRTLVEGDSDLATAYGLAKQIQVSPLSQWHPRQ